MKKIDLLEEAQERQRLEKRELAIEEIKTRLDEISAMKQTLIEMEKQLNELLEEDVDETLF